MFIHIEAKKKKKGIFKVARETHKEAKKKKKRNLQSSKRDPPYLLSKGKAI